MRCWILQHTAIRIENFSNDILRLIEVIGIADTYGHVDTTGVIGCDVDNRTRHDRRIWLDDLLVVGGFHYRNENADFLNYACLSSGINKVANFEGAKHDNEHVRGEV